MAERALREFDAKTIVGKWISKFTSGAHKGATELAQVSLGGSDTASVASAATGGAAATATGGAGGAPSGGGGVTAKALIEEELVRLEKDKPWLSTTKLVVKPDVLIKRRGKVRVLQESASMLGPSICCVPSYATTCQPSGWFAAAQR